MNNNECITTKYKLCQTSTLRVNFNSTTYPKAKIILEFSSDENDAQKDFVNILKNLYIEKLKKMLERQN